MRARLIVKKKRQVQDAREVVNPMRSMWKQLGVRKRLRNGRNVWMPRLRATGEYSFILQKSRKTFQFSKGPKF